MTAATTSLRLAKPYLKRGAIHNLFQIGYRRDAIEHAFAALNRMLDANLGNRGSDLVAVEIESAMSDRVAESLLQGAYLREYHLWEKDCKAYFVAMAARNGAALPLKVRSGETFPDAVKDALAAFGVTIPEAVFSDIERMRERVNVMKHEAGLELDHFVTQSDYAEAMQALEYFWDNLASREQITG